MEIKEQSCYRPGGELSRFSARQEEANAAIAAGNDGWGNTCGARS